MSPLATVGILSLGDMGVGIANLLGAHGFRVLTNATGRSSYTRDRAASASVDLVDTDLELVHQCDYILSIVPPRDALSIATRISRALNSAPPRPPTSAPLYFLDLNATSPLTAQKMVETFAGLPSEMARVLDGGIIGGPPHRASADSSCSTPGLDGQWFRPSVVISGPSPLNYAPVAGAELERVLHAKHVHDTIGPATGLKMVFASLNKGFTALAIQAYATAEQLHVLPELRDHMAEYSPALAKRAESGLPGMCPKAYRWVGEMDEIAETMRLFGGFAGRDDAAGVDGDVPAGGKDAAALAQGGDLFHCVSQIYRFVADDTPLGQERIGQRKLGTTPDDVAKVCAENLKPQRRTDS